MSALTWRDLTPARMPWRKHEYGNHASQGTGDPLTVRRPARVRWAGEHGAAVTWARYGTGQRVSGQLWAPAGPHSWWAVQAEPRQFALIFESADGFAEASPGLYAPRYAPADCLAAA